MDRGNRMEVPAFKAEFRVVPVVGAGALLLSNDGVRVLPGRAYERIVPLVDGRRSGDQIVAAAIERGVDAATAWHALFKLESNGHLTRSRPALDQDASAFWAGLGVDPARALAALRSARVRVFSISTVDAEHFGRALGRCGIAASCPPLDAAVGGSDGDFDVVLADDYLADALLALDEAARSVGRRWMLVRPTGFQIWIGPLLEPGATGCLHCVRHRHGRYRSEALLAARLEPDRGTATPLPALTATKDAACRLAVVEVAKALTGVAGDLTGSMLTIDLRDRSAQVHRLIGNPHCRACGQAPTGAAVPLRLRKHQSAVLDSDGGYRTVPPEETVRKYSRVVSPIIGIVSSLTDVSPAREVGHVYLADTVNRVALDPDGHFWVDRYHAAGKGMTAIQAQASALGEAIERYSFARQGTDLTIPGSLSELGADAIHPNDVMNFSERQYRERQSRNLVRIERRFIPEPFDPDSRIDWTPLWSLTERRHKLLPTDLLLFSRPGASSRTDEPSDPPRSCVVCSNGCASGNTLEEAVLQGLLEVIERDAVATWWYNRLRRPAVDLASLGDRWLSNVGTEYAQWARDIVALDLTNDLGIPVIASVSHLRAGDRERILLGFGCHVDVRIAVQRAVTELCQSLILEIDPRFVFEDREFSAWMESASRAEHDYLVPDDAVPPRTRDDFLPPPTGNPLTAAIERCREAVESRGMEVLVLDQTRPDIGMPVVKVVVPGLRHFWARFAPGRLYDVPVATGLLDAPLTESELNPVPCFL